MRLLLWITSRTGTEGLPLSSLNCERPLRSEIRAPETVMSTDAQIRDATDYGEIKMNI